MTNPLAQDLGGVVRLLEKATPGEWQVIEDSIPWSFSDGRTGNHTQRRIFTAWDHPQLKGPAGVTNIAYGIGLHDAEKKGVQFVSMSREDADAIVSCIAFLRTHSAEIAGALRDAERYRWLRMRLAAEELDNEDAARMALSMVGPIVFRPADADYCDDLDTAIDSAMQQGGGGE